MKRILSTLALAATISFTTMAQIVDLHDKAYLHPREDGKIERLYGPDFHDCDTATLAQLYQEWDEYTRKHPTDETGWRNYAEAQRRYWMNRKWPDESRTADINLVRRLKESIPDTYTYYYMMIRWSAVDFRDDDAPEDGWKRAQYENACKAMELLPDDVEEQEVKDLVGIMIDNLDTLRTNRLLFELYNRNLMASGQLQYHFNELQGMPDSALYIGDTHDFIPKLVIQRVLGLHRDKVFYNQGSCFDKSYNAKCFKLLGIPELDFDEWLRIHGTWTNEDWYRQFDWNKKVVQHICDHSTRPVCFSANGLSSDWLTDSLRARLYNEGLTLRYSATPYDNFAVKRRNIDQRYHLEYLLYPFQAKPKWNRSWGWYDVGNAENYVQLLKDQLPWYKKHDRKGYERLGHLFFRIAMNPVFSVATQVATNQRTDALPEGLSNMQDVEIFMKGVEFMEKYGIEKFLEEFEKHEKKQQEAEAAENNPNAKTK